MHGALCIVHRSGQHTDEWHGDIVGYLVGTDVAPLHLFQPVNGFIVDDIGISAVQPGRFVRAVKVYHQLIFSGSFGSPVVEVYHFLVIPIHKVNLESFDAHFGIVLAYMFHVAGKGMVTCPKDESYILLPGIGRELF